MSKKSKEFDILKDWRNHQASVLLNMYPELDPKDLKNLLDNIIDERVTSPDVSIHNSYVHKHIDDSLLGVTNWFNRSKPIAGGFGVFFKNQHEAINPSAVMLENFMNLRNVYKSQLKSHPAGSYEYLTFDRLQGSEKINANSFYGASGSKASNFYNLYAATSVTAAGQSLISSTEQAFEAFLANNNPFIDLDDCMNFLENIRKEKTKLDTGFLRKITVDDCMDRLEKMFYKYKEDEYERIIASYLLNQSPEYLQRLYYKNNIYEFSYLPKIRNMLTAIATKTEEFKDPNKIPKEIKDELNTLWEYYYEFVVYNYFPFDRIKRLKEDNRKAVIIVDTDSNFLNLNPWVVFMNNFIIKPNDVLVKKDYETLRFISINTMCFLITKMITEVLWKYTEGANIPKEFRPKISMKNEYLLSRLIAANTKKRYASTVRLREGTEIFPEKTDLKGYDFAKTTTREETREYLTRVLEERILRSKNIDIGLILRDMEEFETMIRKSLMSGEKNYLIPKSVKELAAYDKPFSQQGIRAVVCWNYLYPENTINLPEKLDIIKVKLSTEKELEQLKDVSLHHYEIIKEKIFNNKNKDLSSKGVQVIALPRIVQAIPEWIIPFIDYNTIITDNLKKFDSILESLGVHKVKTTKFEYISNILKI